ncbi:DDB1- and CUL4-associated factor 8 isoform X1 [Hydra vulgaris]|uniref:DDB1- and CUL4-associated factor 8 isoform X1 n=1 Tax=Hydra vulgaris TaxID=6087 RepID=UPI001F5E62D5|nr:DDB1- and CUL4-associated factor 8-like [Hydra vulgaris]
MKDIKKESFQYGMRSLNSRSSGCMRPKLFHDNVSSARLFVSRLNKFTELEFHKGCVNSLNFNQSGELIVSGSDDLQIAIWDWTRYCKTPFLTYNSGHTRNVFQAKFMPNSNNATIASCAQDGQIRIGWILSEVDTKKIAQHKGASHKLTVEDGSPHILKTVGEDAVVYHIDLRESQPHKLMTLNTQKNCKVPLFSISSNPMNSCEFCVAGRDPWARIYDTRKIDESGKEVLKKFCPTELQAYSGFAANITCSMYNYNGSELLCSYNDDDIYLFHTTDSESEPKHTYKGHRNSDTVKGVNFLGSRSEYIVSGSDCGYIYIWQKDTEEIVNFLHGDNVGVVNVLEPHPNECILATAGLDHEVKIWMPTGEGFNDLEKLNKQVKVNLEARLNDRKRAPDLFESQLIFLMVRHHQRQRRRRLSQNEDGLEENIDDSSDDDDDNDDDDDDNLSMDDNDSLNDTGARCVQS